MGNGSVVVESLLSCWIFAWLLNVLMNAVGKVEQRERYCNFLLNISSRCFSIFVFEAIIKSARQGYKRNRNNEQYWRELCLYISDIPGPRRNSDY